MNTWATAHPHQYVPSRRGPNTAPPEVLFTTNLRHEHYDVTKDGQRFLLNRRLDSGAQTSIVLVQNWLTGLVEE